MKTKALASNRAPPMARRAQDPIDAPAPPRGRPGGGRFDASRFDAQGWRELKARVSPLAEVLKLFRPVEPERALSDEERLVARKVFGGLDLSSVRIQLVDGRQARSVTTLGYTIYIPRESWHASNQEVRDAVLVHELVHVWQYQQRGPAATLEALAAQLREGTYDVAAAVAKGSGWEELNPEHQAELVGAAFFAGYFDRPTEHVLANPAVPRSLQFTELFLTDQVPSGFDGVDLAGVLRDALSAFEYSVDP